MIQLVGTLASLGVLNTEPICQLYASKGRILNKSQKGLIMTKEISTYEKLSKIKEENSKMARNKLPVNVKKNEILSRGIPRKPSNLTPGAVMFWDMIIDRLIKIGSIDICDDLSLSILSESLSEYFELTHFLNKNGRVYEFKNHKNEISLRTRPECKILSDCWSRIYPLLKEYGLTFKSRADITPIPLKQTESVWGALRK